MEKTYDIIYSIAGKVHTQMRGGQSKVDGILYTIKAVGGRIIAVYESSDNRVNEFID